MNLVSRAGLCGLTALAALLPFGRALAQDVNPPCDAIPGLTGPVIYGVGGSAQTPLIGRIASALASAADPITIVYQDSGACKALEGLNPTVPAENRYLTGEAKYWTSASATSNKVCVLPARDAAPTSAACSSTPTSARTSTRSTTASATSKVRSAPSTLIVPQQSSQNSISARGRCTSSSASATRAASSPWTRRIRTSCAATRTSAVQLYLAAAADLPDAFNPNVGVDAKTNGNSIAGLRPAGRRAKASAGDQARGDRANYEATIGFVSGEQADEATATRCAPWRISTRGQECAYWPDSTRDRRSTRSTFAAASTTSGADVHFFAPDRRRTSEITDENVRKFIGYITGESRSAGGVADPRCLHRQRQHPALRDAGPARLATSARSRATSRTSRAAATSRSARNGQHQLRRVRRRRRLPRQRSGLPPRLLRGEVAMTSKTNMKTLALLAGLALGSISLAACGDDDETTPPETDNRRGQRQQATGRQGRYAAVAQAAMPAPRTPARRPVLAPTPAHPTAARPDSGPDASTPTCPEDRADQRGVPQPLHRFAVRAVRQPGAHRAPGLRRRRAAAE